MPRVTHFTKVQKRRRAVQGVEFRLNNGSNSNYCQMFHVRLWRNGVQVQRRAIQFRSAPGPPHPRDVARGLPCRLRLQSAVALESRVLSCKKQTQRRGQETELLLRSGPGAARNCGRASGTAANTRLVYGWRNKDHLGGQRGGDLPTKGGNSTLFDDGNLVHCYAENGLADGALPQRGACVGGSTLVSSGHRHRNRMPWRCPDRQGAHHRDLALVG